MDIYCRRSYLPSLRVFRFPVLTRRIGVWVIFWFICAVNMVPSAKADSMADGIRLYREGKYPESSEAFAEAAKASDPQKKADALFNLGNAEAQNKNLKVP